MKSVMNSLHLVAISIRIRAILSTIRKEFVEDGQQPGTSFAVVKLELRRAAEHGQGSELK